MSGAFGEVPEVVLDEPEDRVGDHVVEAVVGLLVGLDHRHPVVRSRRCRVRPGRPLLRRRRRPPSVIAEAIQSASRWRRGRRSAVTRPPPPRRTVRLPSSSRSNWAGPRLADDDQRLIRHAAKVTGGRKPSPVETEKPQVSSRFSRSSQSRTGAARGPRGGRAPCLRGRSVLPSPGSLRISRLRPRTPRRN